MKITTISGVSFTPSASKEMKEEFQKMLENQFTIVEHDPSESALLDAGNKDQVHLTIYRWLPKDGDDIEHPKSRGTTPVSYQFDYLFDKSVGYSDMVNELCDSEFFSKMEVPATVRIDEELWEKVRRSPSKMSKSPVNYFCILPEGMDWMMEHFEPVFEETEEPEGK